MDHQYTLAAVEKAWAKAGNYGSIAERIERAKRWNSFYAWQAGKMRGQKFKPEPDYFLQRLLDIGEIRADDNILDIGAGGGRYTLAFALSGGHVTALDGCRENLDLIRERADRLNIQNITGILSFWEEFYTDQKYDLTFCSMCPAICTKEDILKMEQMTRRLCCVITVMKGSYDKHRMQMIKDLNVKTDGTLGDAIHYFNMLYLMERDPDVCCQDIYVEKKIPEEEVLEQYAVYFQIFGIQEDMIRDYLKNYLKEHAKDGYLTEKSRYRLAMVTWKPNSV